MSIYDADKNADPDAPGKGHHGGIVSAPLAARILNRSLEYLAVPESPDLPEPPPEIAAQLHNYKPPKKKPEN